MKARSKNGRLVEMWKDTNTKKWIVGMQGTSQWYVETSLASAKKIYKKLINEQGEV